MAQPEHFDAIVIGSGQGGSPLASELASNGKKTAIVERKYVGGTCINYGCTPTKTMVASARMAYVAGRAGEFGVNISSFDMDLAHVRKRKQEVVESFRNGTRRRLEDAQGLSVIFGEASFIDRKTISVQTDSGGRTISGDLIFINTGARPAVPAIEGLSETAYLDSTSIMELNSVPKHLMVLGGGYVGLEFGQMFRRFGAEVTVVQRGGRLLAREDDDVAQEVKKILEEDGITVHLNAEAKRVSQSGGTLSVCIDSSAGQKTLSGSDLLVAVGRVPNTEALALAMPGVETDKRGFIRADEHLKTSVDGIYAIGDVKGGPAFTHISYDDFRVLKNNLFGDGTASTRNRLVPYTVYIDPQLGRVGMNEEEARSSGRKVCIAKMPMTSVARAIEVGETRGFLKAIVDAETDRILGCAMLGFEGGELMSMMHIAMMGKLPYPALRDGIFAHPTLAESLNNLFTSFQE